MFVKFNERAEGRRFTFFAKEREVNGNKVQKTDKCVFGTLSEGIKVGEQNGKAIWENDYWNTTFCGKAYEKALSLKDKDKIIVVEMNIRNIYSKNTKKSYPQITVTDFDVYENANENSDNEATEPYVNISQEELDNLPFE